MGAFLVGFPENSTGLERCLARDALSEDALSYNFFVACQVFADTFERQYA